MPRGQDLLIVVLKRVGLRFKTSLGSRRGCPIKFLPSTVRLGIDRVYNSKPKKGRDTSSPTKKPTCGKFGKKHYGDCFKGMDNCFGCGKSGPKCRDFPYTRGQDKGIGQA